jgi:hypothetical protein
MVVFFPFVLSSYSRFIFAIVFLDQLRLELPDFAEDSSAFSAAVVPIEFIAAIAAGYTVRIAYYVTAASRVCPDWIGHVEVYEARVSLCDEASFVWA